MSEDQGDIRRQLDAHTRRDDLARLVRTVALSAADERRARFSDGLDELLRETELEPEDGVVGKFNVLRALSTNEPPAAPGGEVLGVLLARGLRLDIDARDDALGDDDWKRLAESLTWLGANTHISAMSALDSELDAEQAANLWRELADLVSRADAGGAPRGRGEAMVASAALRASASAAATTAREGLEEKLRDPLLRTAFSASGRVIAPAQDGDAPAVTAGSEPAEDAQKVADDGASEPPARKRLPAKQLSGEVVPTPLGPIGLILMTVTGLILLRYLFRFVANVLLRCRRPVEVTVADGGVTLNMKLDVLGKTVRTRETHIPLGNLARAVREVRYPRLALYAGLTALALGTYLGISLVTDGARAGSPSLLGLGAGIFAAGVLLDLVFSTLLPGKTGKHSVIFVPRKGRSVAVRVTDGQAADEALRTLSAAAA